MNYYLRGILILFAFIYISPQLIAQTTKPPYDVAFVLRGYDKSSLFEDSLDFSNKATEIMSYLNKLSFGTISTYRVFTLGADERGPVQLQSIRDIETLQDAMNGWPGSKWDWLRNRTDFWYVIPTEYRPKVQLVIDWMKTNKLDYSSWENLPNVNKEDANQIRNNIIRMGPGSGSDFLLNLKMPPNFNPNDFRFTAIVLNSKSTQSVSGGGLQSILSNFGLLDANGKPYPVDVRYKVQFTYFSPRREITAGVDISTSVHESIHALGMGTHDIDGQERLLSVMCSNGQLEAIGTLPAWDRYFWNKWLPKSTITTDSSQVVDLKFNYKPEDLSKKFIYEVIKGDDMGRGGTYMEKFNGNWYSYKVDNYGTLTFTSDYKNIENKAPQTVILDVPENVFPNDTVAFYASYTGDRNFSNLVFKWYKDGVELVGSSKFKLSSNALIINNVQKSDEGFYQLKVTNRYGTGQSLNLKMRVKCDAPAAPTVVSNLVRCQFDSPTENLQASAISGNQLLWYQTADLSEKPSETALPLNTQVAGDFTKFVSQKNTKLGCESQRVAIKYKVIAKPATPVISLNEQYQLVSTGTGLSWYFNGTLLADTSKVIKPTSNGTFTVRSKVNGCQSDLSVPFSFLITEVENNEKNLQIFPNPFLQSIRIKNQIAGNQVYQMEVVDLNGRVQYASRLYGPENEIQLNKLNAGTYFLRIWMEDNPVQIFKIVKQ